MQNPRNLSVHPHQGKQLPHDWAATAAARAQAADDAYARGLKRLGDFPWGATNLPTPRKLPCCPATTARAPVRILPCG
jgi:hypothetical protein